MQEQVWLDDASCDLEEFARHVSQVTLAQDYPLSSEIAQNIPIYDGAALATQNASDADWKPVMAEWNRAFATGPGIVALRRGYTDLQLIDDVTGVLNTIIQEEEAEGAGQGDHFATTGANSRIWNAHEKLGVRAPELFVRYNTNECIRRVSEAWLGTGYQITTQANVVRPGGKAQTAHRDYHMGFQSSDDLKTYPATQHALSAQLTLQGAVAHCDMPLVSGPTKLLPYSQSYLPGYLAVLRDDFRTFFEQYYVQIPLQKGDLLFFNPATFHSAGENLSQDIQRFANLMQIGSAYGRSIEIVDRARLSNAVYGALTKATNNSSISLREADNVVAACAEGYPFPANLDIDSPLSGMAPPSQQDVMRQALAGGWSNEAFAQAITEQLSRKRSH